MLTEIFVLISPYLVEHPSDGQMKITLEKCLRERENLNGYSHDINDQEFKTITIQLKAYGLVTTRYLRTTKGGMALFWSLTGKGEQLMLENMVVR